MADAVRLSSYAAALVLYLQCKARGLVTSGPLFTFWLAASICGAPTFRSILMWNTEQVISSGGKTLDIYLIH